MSGANRVQRDNWNGDHGRRWVADADRRDRVLAPVADALLEAAALQAGEAVLDLGCGCGATSISAAQLVGDATVVGIDLSAPMLEVARGRTGTSEIEFLQADAQTHAFPQDAFDAVIGRFGTMFFDDPVAAFANIGGAVRVGGRLCLATWQPLAANDWLAVPGATLLRYGELPDAVTEPGPGMFAQSETETVEDVLVRAGWISVEVTPIRVELCLGADASDALDYLADTGVASAVIDTIEPDRHAEAMGAVEDTLREHETDRGVLLGAGINLIRAVRP